MVRKSNMNLSYVELFICFWTLSISLRFVFLLGTLNVDQTGMQEWLSPSWVGCLYNLSYCPACTDLSSTGLTFIYQGETLTSFEVWFFIWWLWNLSDQPFDAFSFLCYVRLIANPILVSLRVSPSHIRDTTDQLLLENTFS